MMHLPSHQITLVALSAQPVYVEDIELKASADNVFVHWASSVLKNGEPTVVAWLHVDDSELYAVCACVVHAVYAACLCVCVVLKFMPCVGVVRAVYAVCACVLCHARSEGPLKCMLCALRVLCHEVRAH